MGTRATVHFQRNGTTKAIVYRHFDGYPDGLGCDLDLFLAELPTSLDQPATVAARFVAWQEKQGHDIDIILHDPGDIEYRYLVDCDEFRPPSVEVQHLDLKE